jgi:succinyl-CoA synthetase beta subunit
MIRMQETAIGPWTESDARDLLREAGIPLVPAMHATTPDAAVEAAQYLGLPVAIKVHSHGLAHKSDAGGVQLNVSSLEGVAGAVSNILRDVSARRPDVEVDGVLVSPMRVGGIELIVGVTRDSVFGLTLAVGLGGIWVEVLHDVSLRVLPVTRRDVAAMLGELRGSVLFNGHRGAARVDVDRVITVVTRIAALATDLEPVLESLEVNPLWCDGDQIEALDALVATTASTRTSESAPSDAKRNGT